MFSTASRRVASASCMSAYRRGIGAAAWMHAGSVSAARVPYATATGQDKQQQQQQQQQQPRSDVEKMRKEVLDLYHENHIPLGHARLRTWAPPYTDVAKVEAASGTWVHHTPPGGGVDKMAYNLMQFLRVFVHQFFRDKYVHHAVTLETVAAVPGMIAAMLRHFRSLRTMRKDYNKIEMLLEEAENERMHLLTWMEVAQPSLLERFLVILAQMGFTTFYTICYIVSPRFSHRLVAYLEEEAYNAYTDFLNAIDQGKIHNIPAPEFAMRYWNLAPDSKLRDVVVMVRSDEAAHREYNHDLSDRAVHGLH